MPVEATDGIRFRQIAREDLIDDFENTTEWPRLSCSQANQLALEFGELTIDGNLTVKNEIATEQLNVTGSITEPLKLDDNLSIDGHVGIGTTFTPTEKLEVAGKIKATNLDISNAIATQQLSVAGSVTGSLTVENDLTVGNSLSTNEIHATGTIRANRFEGDGSNLTGVVKNLDSVVKKTGDTMTGSLTIQESLHVTHKISAGSLEIEGSAILGYESKISNFGDPLKSGFYENGGTEIVGDVPDKEHRWTHLITSRHSNTGNNYQLQIAASYFDNDRLFFRKISGSLEPINPNWHEVATRGGNTFTGKQIINGAATVTNGSNVANGANYMASGSLTIGATDQNYGGGGGWNENTAGLLMETKSNTEIAIHDSYTRLASFMYYEGDKNKITIGRDMGWGGLANLEVNGAATVTNGSNFANGTNYMASGSLTIGATDQNYGGGGGWNENTAGLLMETKSNTEIAIHDSYTRLASFMYYEGDKNKITIGRDMGWGGLANLEVNGTATIPGILYDSLEKRSSRKLKENITVFSAQEAFVQLESLVPVTFNFKEDRARIPQLGFIAEDVPSFVASHDKKAVNNDCIVAILTKVVKEQQQTILALTEKVNFLEKTINHE